MIWITFIFDRCHRSWAAVTPVKYKRDIQWLTCVLAMLKNEENNGTGEMGLVTPIPERRLASDLDMSSQYTDHIKLSHSCSIDWRHNGPEGVSDHQPHSCLLNRLSRRRSKRTSKLCVTGLCAGNSPLTGEFPSQRASNAENVSIWWRHQDYSRYWWWRQ